MDQTLGKVGCVKTVYSDGDMRVLVASQEWTFNPLCCTLVPHRVEDMNNTLGSGTDRTDPMRKQCVLLVGVALAYDVTIA